MGASLPSGTGVQNAAADRRRLRNSRYAARADRDAGSHCVQCRNLVPVAQTLRQLQPDRIIYIAGDSDHQQEAKGKPNVGREKATGAHVHDRWLYAIAGFCRTGCGVRLEQSRAQALGDSSEMGSRSQSVNAWL